MRHWLLCASFVVACACEPGPQTPSAPPRGRSPEARAFSLPGAVGPAFVDYIAYEPKRERIWVPVGDTGSVDVFDIARSTFTRVDGFETVQRAVREKTRTVGPSAASVGEGFVYVGNRATNAICPVDAVTLERGACVGLAVAVDGVSYVAATKEVWVIAGDDKALVVLDASTPNALRVKSTITVPGAAEGYAVDNMHSLFFTNLEDKDQTLAIDLGSHAVRSTWHPGCGEKGPRGVAVDPARNLVFVACTDHLQVLDAAHDGALLGKLDTGPGVDNIDILPAEGLLYAASGGAARLTIARVGTKGELTMVAQATTAEGARTVVTDHVGNAFVADPRGARLLEVPRVR